MRPVRILLMITDSGIGGTEKVVSFVARNLDPERFHPIVCSVKPAGEMAREVMGAGVDFFSLNFKPSNFAAGLFRAARAVRPLSMELRERKVSLVHSFLFLANMIGRAAAGLAGLPNISSIRVEEREKGYHHFAERLTSRMVDIYLAPSSRVADYAACRAGIPSEKLVVIPNAVERKAEGEPFLRPLLGLDKDEFLVGFVGRLHRQKGVDVLLRACSLLPHGKRPELAVIGDGPERGRLEEESKKLGLDRKVHFTGWISEVSRVIRELNVLAVPSRWEGLPNVILEGMAAGVPVVASSVGGVPELIEDGCNGFLIPPERPDALASMLYKISSREVDTSGAARKALKMVMEHYQPETVLEKFHDLYDNILGGGHVKQ